MEIKIVIIGLARDHLTQQTLVLKNDKYESPEYDLIPYNSIDENLGQIVEKLGFDKQFLKPILIDVQTKTRYTDSQFLLLYYGVLLPSDTPPIGGYSLIDTESIAFAIEDEEWILMRKMNHMAVLP